MAFIEASKSNFFVRWESDFNWKYQNRKDYISYDIATKCHKNST